GGASAWRESTALDPALLASTQRLVRALNWTGLIMVEYKLGERPWLIEINGRVWGSLPLAVLAGVDFPAELAELHFPGAAPHDPTKNADYRAGLRAYTLELMLSWIAQVLSARSRHESPPPPGRERALAALAGLLDPAQKSDLSGARDFRPR